MTTLFLCMTVGALPLFVLLASRPYGLQAASAIEYTILVTFYTFSRNGRRDGTDNPGYMFTCPAVRSRLFRLIWCHFGFVVALFALQTLVLARHPSLPDRWVITLLFIGGGLGLTEIFTNRYLLDRAHRLE
jgi:hypothetical protein